MRTKIVKNKTELRVPSINVDMEEGQQIADKLFKVLEEYKGSGCVSLAAPQIGINKSVAVVNVTEPKFFVNASFESTEKTDKRLIYREACLSFPNELFWTLRCKDIKVKSDNFANDLFFGPTEDKSKDKGWSKSEFWNDAGIMESCYLQQALSLVQGKLITDPEFVYTQKPQKNSAVKYGRNDQVMVSDKAGKTHLVKYKKALPMLENGTWFIV
jgi:hypothetical protein